MRLFLDIGYYERSTKRGINPGSCLAAVTENAREIAQGVLLACAEAIADRPDGENAARSATTALGDVYYAADAASPRETLQEGLHAANHAVRATGERGRAVAVAALVLHGRRWYAGHAGHIRAWRCRDMQIKQLTRDHLLPLAPRRTEITKACGYGDVVDAEYGEGGLKEGDVFLLTSPGVHDVLAGSILLSVLQSDGTAQQIAETLVQHALAAHTPPYAGVCIARVEKLPTETTQPVGGSGLPLLALPQAGTEVDGFAIEKLILKSRRFRLYQAKDGESGETVVLRFPDPSFEGNAQSFLREESIGQRLDNPHLLKPISLRPGRRTARYSALEYRKSENLAKRIKRKHYLPPEEALPLAEQLLAALEALHRQGVVHGDIRPHHLLHDKRARHIYLVGMTANPRDEASKIEQRAPSRSLTFRAPELFGEGTATERSDIYAAGVTVYQMLTGKFPYGKIRSNTDKKQFSYTTVRHYQEGLPIALDDILARACAVDPADRYPTVTQFAAALASVPIGAPAAAPTSSPPSSFNTQGYGGWWLAAGLLVALLGYLYFALK